MWVNENFHICVGPRVAVILHSISFNRLNFSFTIMSAGRYAHAKLVKNGQLLVRANGELYDESSHTVVVELKPNDIISVESNEAKADYHGGKYSSFSGFLLYDYSDVVSGPVVGK